MTRLDIEFPSGESRCAAWLFLPETAVPPPVIVMAHGLGATRDMRLEAFALRFVAAGYACLVFDYRHFGDSGGEPRQLLDIARQRADWRAAIACVRARADVDAGRVVLWGTSFAGGHAIAVGAGDASVVAVVAQCPFTDGPASVRKMEAFAAAKVTVLAVIDWIGSLVGRKPVCVATAGRAGETALMTAPDVAPGYLGLVPAKTRFRNEVAARIALAVLFDAPGRHLRDLRCPALVCVCDHDSVAPASATLRHAAHASRVDVRRYAAGHFDIYAGEWFERVIADQLAFLHRHVPTDGTRT